MVGMGNDLVYLTTGKYKMGQVRSRGAGRGQQKQAIGCPWNLVDRQLRAQKRMACRRADRPDATQQLSVACQIMLAAGTHCAVVLIDTDTGAWPATYLWARRLLSNSYLQLGHMLLFGNDLIRERGLVAGNVVHLQSNVHEEGTSAVDNRALMRFSQAGSRSCRLHEDSK